MKKLSIFLASTLLIGGAGVALSVNKGESKQPKVRNDLTVNASEVDTYDWQTECYSFKQHLEIPTYNYGGTDYEIVVEFPNGYATNVRSLYLNQIGTYKIIATSEKNGVFDKKVFKFVVKNQYFSFTGDLSYAAYEATGSERTYNGVGLFVALAPGETIVFNELIDFSTSTVTEPIISTYIAPSVKGTLDFMELNYKFIDSENSDNYLRIRNRSTSEGINAPYTYIMGAGEGQDLAGNERGKIHKNDNFGCPIEQSFMGNYPSGKNVCDVKMNLFFDKDDLALYAHANKTTIITDLDSSDYHSSTWGGFETGKAKLHISANTYSTDFARFVISSIKDLDISQVTYEDDVAPVITPEVVQADVPNAFVGRSYKVFDAVATDNLSGEVKVNAKVCYADGTKRPDVELKDGIFKVENAGNYYITYQATDAVGNVATKKLKVTATETDNPLNVVRSGKLITDIKRGEKYKFPSFIVDGGFGFYEENYKVTFNGKEIETDGISFIPTVLGSYKITYSVKDITQQEYKFEYDLAVTYNSGCVFNDEPELPKYAIAGYEIRAPKYYGIDMSTYEGKKVLADASYIFYKDGGVVSQTNDANPVVPKNTCDEVEIIYTSTGYKKSYKLPVINPWTEDGRKLLMKNYFITSDGLTLTTNSGEQFMSVVANANGNHSWEFANPLISSDFTFQMLPKEGGSTFNSINVTLTDKLDSSKAVTMKLNNDSNIVVSINGKTSKTAYSFSDGNTPLIVSFANNKFGLGETKYGIKTYDDGTLFNGFPSGSVYLSVKMNGCKVDSGYLVQKIDNQQISATAFDSSRPQVSLYESYGGYYSLNTKVQTSVIAAGDVLDPNVDILLTFKDPEGKTVNDVNGLLLEEVDGTKRYTVRLENYGQYAVSYSVKDSKNNKASFGYAFGVLDEVLPEISFAENPISVFKVNEMIVVPEIIVTDNLTASENIITYVTIKSPTGRIYLLPSNSNSMKAIYKGIYTITVTAIDEEGNIASLSYEVTVE